MGEADHVHRSDDPDGPECSGQVPILVSVGWNPDAAWIDVVYFLFNVVGLPHEVGLGDSTQYLRCVYGGRRPNHVGSWDRQTGAVEIQEQPIGTGLREFDIEVDWDPQQGLVHAVTGGLASGDAGADWELFFALTDSCAVGYSLNDFTAANIDPQADSRALYESLPRPERGGTCQGTTPVLSPSGSAPSQVSRALPNHVSDCLEGLAVSTEFRVDPEAAGLLEFFCAIDFAVGVREEDPEPGEDEDYYDRKDRYRQQDRIDDRNDVIDQGRMILLALILRRSKTSTRRNAGAIRVGLGGSLEQIAAGPDHDASEPPAEARVVARRAR